MSLNDYDDYINYVIDYATSQSSANQSVTVTSGQVIETYGNGNQLGNLSGGLIGQAAGLGQMIMPNQQEWVWSSPWVPGPRIPHKGETEMEVIETPTKMAVADSDATEEYFQLAERLGIKSAKVTQARLERFLHKEAMGVYDYKKVDAYMQRLAERKRLYWCWKPVREKDTQWVSGLGFSPTVSYHSQVVKKTYPHEIPPAALLTLDKIATAFPEALFFATMRLPSPIRSFRSPRLRCCYMTAPS
jgi:hypothetical protein